MKLNFGPDFEHKVWSRFKVESFEMKRNFGQYFPADVWLRLRSLILVEILKLGLVNNSSLGEILMFG